MPWTAAALCGGGKRLLEESRRKVGTWTTAAAASARGSRTQWQPLFDHGTRRVDHLPWPPTSVSDGRLGRVSSFVMALLGRAEGSDDQVKVLCRPGRVSPLGWVEAALGGGLRGHAEGRQHLKRFKRKVQQSPRPRGLATKRQRRWSRLGAASVGAAGSSSACDLQERCRDGSRRAEERPGRHAVADLA